MTSAKRKKCVTCLVLDRHTSSYCHRVNSVLLIHSDADTECDGVVSPLRDLCNVQCTEEIDSRQLSLEDEALHSPMQNADYLNSE